MCATCSEVPQAAAAVRAGSRRVQQAQRGFSMVELIAVLMLVGVLAVVAMPRMTGAISLRSSAWRDQVQAALLHARTLAQGHRRLVCVVLATGDVRLSLASANPATACDTALSGPDGDVRWAFDSQGITLTQSPTGTLYFQPDGRATSDGAGTSSVNATIALTGETSLQLTGETGHVQ